MVLFGREFNADSNGAILIGMYLAIIGETGLIPTRVAYSSFNCK